MFLTNVFGASGMDTTYQAMYPVAAGATFALPPSDDLATDQATLEEENRRLANLNRAQAMVQGAMSAGRFIQTLDSLAWIEFPVALKDTVGNIPIAIVFDNLRLYPDYAQLEVVLRMDLPQRKVGAMNAEGGAAGADDYVSLYFGTPNLKFSHDGGIIGDATLGLYADVPIGTTNPSKFAFILRGWHEHRQGGTTQDLGTYAKIDCDGFVEMGVEADVLFSRDWIVPVNAQDEPKPTGRVTGHIQTVVSDWQNLLVEISLPNFAPTSYPDIAFNVSTAVFDFSDYRNSPSVVFPEGYAAQHLMPTNPNLWRGVYIRNLELSLPKQIKDKDCVATTAPPPAPSGTGMLILDESGTYAYGMVPTPGMPDHGPAPVEVAPLVATNSHCRTRVGVNHLLIDGTGVSGLFYAENVLPIEQGSAGGWAFSVESARVEMVSSDVTAFGFAGQMRLPVSKVTESLGYTAFIDIPDREYHFDIILGQDQHFPVFKMADVTILAGSYVSITSRPSHFEPVAVLYGFATVKAKNGSASADGDDSDEPDDKLSFKVGKLTFSGLKLQTHGTTMSLIPGGSLGVEVGMTLLGYPLPIANPMLVAMPNGDLRLRFDIKLNLMEQAHNGFEASSSILIDGRMQTNDQIQKWQNSGFSVGSIYVRIELPSLRLIGYAHIFDEHPVYGNGFQGALDVEVGPEDNPIVAVELNAMFGKTSFRYWYVDGFIELESMGIPLIPGVAEINGFGGGAYYHMKMAGMDLMNGSDGSAGVTTSGVRYEPYEATTLGLKATVAIRSPGTETLDAVATLELRFGSGGIGLQEIAFYGKAEIVSPKINEAITGAVSGFSEELGERMADLAREREEQMAIDAANVQSPQNAIYATLFIRMNFEQGFEFQGTFRCELDAANGVIQGYGGVDILASTPQNRWHLYVGGYTDSSIMASDGAPLPPIGVRLNLGEGITAGADAYFLTGNDIPGPPPLHPAAAAYFGTSSSSSNNRASLGNRAASGTGFAFGAAVFAYVDARIRRRGAYSDNSVQANLGAGFDVSLLKYAPNTFCSQSGHTPHGHKGWRATGRIWAYIDGVARYRGVRKNLSMGVLVDADIPKPTFLRVHLRFHLIVDINVRVELGDECGTPYNP